MQTSPTQEIYGALERAAEYFNRELFGGVLTPCLITVQRGKKYIGYFAPSRWENRDGRRTHEIAMNPTAMAERTLLDVLSTLAHELAHQAQHERGTAPRTGYHDKNFAAIMEDIGLITSSTAAPGGARTGQHVSHYIVEGGRFHEAARALAATEYFLPWIEWGAVRVIPTRIYDSAGRPCEPVIGATPPQACGSIGMLSWPPDDEAETETVLPPDDEIEIAPTPSGPDDILNRPLTRLSATPSYPESEASPSSTKSPKSSKTKYTCPECAANIWGKPNLNVICGGCGVSFVESSP